MILKLQTPCEADPRPIVWKITRALCRLAASSLLDLKVFGVENVPARGGALVVCNHQSYLDPIVLTAKVRRPLQFMGKEELFTAGPRRERLIRALGAFPVRQGACDLRAVREAIARLQAGRLVNIFPEGARTPDGEIGKIQEGIALIDRRAHVPLIPAVIVGAYEAWPIHRRFPRPWPVRVQFGPPMQVADLSPEQITTLVDRTLKRMFEELRGRERKRPLFSEALMRVESPLSRDSTPRRDKRRAG
jgi:1-acyl-sn-glycerol-3-phosphate acyltransferase